MRLALASLALCACGRTGFDPRSDAAPPGDAFVDAIARHCDWSAGPQLGPLVLRDDLSSPQGEFDVYLVPGDPLTINFNSDRAGGFNTYVAHRPSLDAPFDAPVLVPGLDMNAIAFSFNVIPGGLNGYLSLDQDLYDVSRASPTSTVVLGRKLDELDTPDQEFDPFPSQDDLTLTWAAGTVAAQDLFTATRATRGDPWSNIVKIPVSTGGDDSGPSLTADGLVLVWQTNDDLYYSTRASTADPFTVTHPLLITPNMDFEPFVREDGCELWFVQGPGGPPGGNIYSIAID